LKGLDTFQLPSSLFLQVIYPVVLNIYYFYLISNNILVIARLYLFRLEDFQKPSADLDAAKGLIKGGVVSDGLLNM